MGYYIETGEKFGKADWLVRNHGAVRLPHAPVIFTDEVAIIVVVNNGPFEAAAYCFSPDEMNDFNRSNDPRPREWLIMDKAVCHRLCNYTGP